MATRIPDDGDFVRALGFVTMYSAWLEQDIDELLLVLGDQGSEKGGWPISRKVKAAIRRVKEMDSDSSRRLELALKEARSLFELRNDFVHGRNFEEYGRDYLKSGRPNVPTREVSFEELRDLANNLFDARDELLRVILFDLEQ